MCIFYSCECHVPRSVESAGYILDPIASLTRSSFNCNAWDFLVCIGSPSQGKIIGRITLKPLVVVPQQNQFHEALPRTSLSKLQSLSCLRVGGGGNSTVNEVPLLKKCLEPVEPKWVFLSSQSVPRYPPKNMVHQTSYFFHMGPFKILEDPARPQLDPPIRSSNFPTSNSCRRRVWSLNRCGGKTVAW